MKDKVFTSHQKAFQSHQKYIFMPQTNISIPPGKGWQSRDFCWRLQAPRSCTARSPCRSPPRTSPEIWTDELDELNELNDLDE